MAEPEKHDALNAPQPGVDGAGEEESGAGYGNNAGPQSEGEARIDEGLHGGEAEGAGSDQR